MGPEARIHGHIWPYMSLLIWNMYIYQGKHYKHEPDKLVARSCRRAAKSLAARAAPKATLARDATLASVMSASIDRKPEVERTKIIRRPYWILSPQYLRQGCTRTPETVRNIALACFPGSEGCLQPTRPRRLATRSKSTRISLAAIFETEVSSPSPKRSLSDTSWTSPRCPGCFTWQI
jgi:hypothetical protein